MKRSIIIFGIAGFMFAGAAQVQAQNSPKRNQDTSKAWKKSYQPTAVPDPNVPTPVRRTDSTSVYDNRVYENGIKGAEYQNRGAEDRRNLNTADPNAIPNKQVPAKEVLPPPTVK